MNEDKEIPSAFQFIDIEKAFRFIVAIDIASMNALSEYYRLQLSKMIAVFHPTQQKHILAYFGWLRSEGLVRNIEQIVEALEYKNIWLKEFQTGLSKIREKSNKLAKEHPNQHDHQEVVEKVNVFLDICRDKFFELVKLRIDITFPVFPHNSTRFSHIGQLVLRILRNTISIWHWHISWNVNF